MIAQTFAILKKKFPKVMARRAAIVARFKVSERHVDNAVEEFDGEALYEIDRITRAKVDLRALDRDSLARIVQSFRTHARK
jgi:hypothetical protein